MTTQQVIDTLYRKYTSQGQAEGGKIRTSMSDQQRGKLVNHIAALALIIDNYRVPYEELCRDTGIKPRMMGETFRQMGCSCKKLKKQDGSVKAIASLSLPVKLPPVVIRKGGKKRE